MMSRAMSQCDLLDPTIGSNRRLQGSLRVRNAFRLEFKIESEAACGRTAFSASGC